ncbi:AAA family ATPase [Candidatus Pacearchaeota archaeon]|nr:AAA family ATPase [Candidatus Pacearchaeota archaeon]
MEKFNEGVEQAFLGALLTNNKIYDLVSPDFNSAYFFNPVHTRIYDVIATMLDDGRTPAIPLLAKHFADDPDLEHVGGARYLADLADNLISIVAAPDYAKEIYTLHIARMIEAQSQRIKEISNETSDAEKKIAEVEEIAFSLRVEKAGEIKSSETSVNEALKTIEYAQKGFNGIETGLPSLDDIIKGFRPSSLYVLAARPAMGKTALAVTMAENIAEANKKVLFFSLEMDAGQLQQRYIARITGISVDDQMGTLPENKLDEIITACADIGTRSLWIDDQPAQTVNVMLSKSRRHMRIHGIDIIVIDYLGLIAPNDKKANKVHQIEQITTGLKRMSKLLKVPVVLLSQLSRALESRPDKRPVLSDLRDSGAIEQDADVVMFIYRHEMYMTSPPAKSKGGGKQYSDDITQWEEEKERCKGKAEIIVGKNRQGSTRTAYVTFDGRRQEFYEPN